MGSINHQTIVNGVLMGSINHQPSLGAPEQFLMNCSSPAGAFCLLQLSTLLVQLLHNLDRNSWSFIWEDTMISHLYGGFHKCGYPRLQKTPEDSRRLQFPWFILENPMNIRMITGGTPILGTPPIWFVPCIYGDLGDGLVLVYHHSQQCVLV